MTFIKINDALFPSSLKYAKVNVMGINYISSVGRKNIKHIHVIMMNNTKSECKMNTCDGQDF
jgi:hypothetical protein